MTSTLSITKVPTQQQVVRFFEIESEGRSIMIIFIYYKTSFTKYHLCIKENHREQNTVNYNREMRMEHTLI